MINFTINNVYGILHLYVYDEETGKTISDFALEQDEAQKLYEALSQFCKIKEDLDMTEQEIKAYNAGYDDAVKDFSMWHPASELPRKPTNGVGHVIVITYDDEFGISNYADRWNMDGIKWWCYPPEED